MVSHRSGSSILESAGQRLCAAIVASSLILSTTTAHADPPPAAAPEAPAASPAPAPSETSVWGQGPKANGRKYLTLGALGLSAIAGGIGLGFHIDAISKENARQDFIKANGGVDSRPGPGVGQVGPQCHGAAQCAQYLDIRNGRDNSYNLMTGFYAASAGLLFVSAVYYLQTKIDVSSESKTGFVPVVGPQVAGASWEARF